MNTLSDSERLNLAYRVAGPHALRIMHDVLAELGVDRLSELPVGQGSIAIAEMESRVYGDKYDAMKKIVAGTESVAKICRHGLMTVMEDAVIALYASRKEDSK